ncbi:MAG: serine/threonine protein kinase, partial [Candidatus Aminicenantes bacterium]|nr:serine/threonine protein kinase [Candidatus Aminicenantes bacterium]
MVGTRIGEFEIRGELGRGGMGIVYSAYQPSLDRDVAVKILPPNLVNDEELVERFLREARAAAKLNHPNIVTIYQVNQQDDSYYFAMENVSGGSLHDLIKKRGPLPLEESLFIISRVAEGLDYAHRKGIIHRDIKPGNILLDENERPVITDFGIAKVTSDLALTKTGVSFGSPEYMAPEQFKGHPVD